MPCGESAIWYEYGGSGAGTVVRSPPVLWQAHSLRRRLLWLAALSSAALALPALGAADAHRSASTLHAQAASLAAKSRAAVLGLYAVDHDLATAQATLARLRESTHTLRMQRTVLRMQLQVAHRSERIAQRRLCMHLRALYESGSVSDLEVVLGARSLDDALTNLDSLHRVARQDRVILAQVKGTRDALRQATRRLQAHAAALAAAMRAASATEVQLERSQAARNAYIASLAAQRHLTEQQIALVVGQAKSAEARSAAITRRAALQAPSASPVSAPARPATGGGPVAPTVRVLTVSATAYSLPGRTASGMPVGWGVAAVDPTVIPLGTHFTVPGYGEAVAADVGVGIKGNKIDLWFPTLRQAQAWGLKIVTIRIH